MNTVTFGSYNSYNDFNLILTAKTIGSAPPKTETIEIPAGDGIIDYTEYFGGIHYQNRPLSFDFSTIVPQSDFLDLFSTIQDALHGKKMKIVLSDDPFYYYMGRISVDSWKSNGRIGKITIDVDAEPWKYKEYETIRTVAVSESQSIILTNSRKPVVPTITVDAAMTLIFEETTYQLAVGEYEDSRILLKAGNNTFTVSGTGNITFTWQEGRL